MIDDMGGPAFPCLDSNGNGQEGVTVWDHYAAQVLGGLTGSAFKYLSEADTKEPLTEEAYRMLNDIGETAGLMADKMLAERNKRMKRESDEP